MVIASPSGYTLNKDALEQEFNISMLNIDNCYDIFLFCNFLVLYENGFNTRPSISYIIYNPWLSLAVI